MNAQEGRRSTFKHFYSMALECSLFGGMTIVSTHTQKKQKNFSKKNKIELLKYILFSMELCLGKLSFAIAHTSILCTCVCHQH